MDTVISHTVILECLLQWGRTALHYAARSGHVGVVEVLLQNQAHLDAVDKVCEDFV